MDTMMSWLVVALFILLGLMLLWIVGMVVMTIFLFRMRPHDLNDTLTEMTNMTRRKETPVAKESNGNQGSKLRRPKR